MFFSSCESDAKIQISNFSSPQEGAYVLSYRVIIFLKRTNIVVRKFKMVYWRENVVENLQFVSFSSLINLKGLVFMRINYL